MDDLISRQAAIDNLLSINEVVPKNKLIDKNDAFKMLVRLPSAQRTGRWIKNDNGTYFCDQCHSWIPNEQHYYARYCIFCGAKMEVGE